MWKSQPKRSGYCESVLIKIMHISESSLSASIVSHFHSKKIPITEMLHSWETFSEWTSIAFLRRATPIPTQSASLVSGIMKCQTRVCRQEALLIITMLIWFWTASWNEEEKAFRIPFSLVSLNDAISYHDFAFAVEFWHEDEPMLQDQFIPNLHLLKHAKTNLIFAKFSTKIMENILSWHKNDLP